MTMPALDPHVVDLDAAPARAVPAPVIGDVQQLKPRAAGYLGARYDRRSMKEWRPGTGSANADTNCDLPTLRGRSRDLQRNAPIATGAINTVVTSTVGVGLRPQSRIDRELLGLSEDEADAWERHAQRVWRLWADSPNCDVTRTQHFAGLTDQVLRATLASGDVLVIRRFVERGGDLLGLKIQTVEADRISNPQLQGDTDRLIQGVEIDADGAPLRFHVRSRHPGDVLWRGTDSWSAVPAYGLETGERFALLVFKRERPGQMRGVPFLAPVIEPLKQLDRYSEAELTAAVVSALFTVFVKSATPDDGLGGAGLATPDGQLAPAVGDYRLGSGAIVELADGESIETANPNRPNDKFDPFFQAYLRQIGVALEIPFELLIKHFTASYSAARGAMLEAWRAFLTRRQWLVQMFCQPCYEWVIAEAVLRGHLVAPGFFEDPIRRAAWTGAMWVGPAQGQIDPRSEIEAAKGRVELGISTLEQETAAITGGDWEQNHVQQVKEQRARTRDGLGVQPSATAPAGPVTPEPALPVQDETTDTPLAGVADRVLALSGSGPQPRGR